MKIQCHFSQHLCDDKTVEAGLDQAFTNKKSRFKNQILMGKFFSFCPKMVNNEVWCGTTVIAGSLEAAYSLNWGGQEIWGKDGGETLALL